MDNEHLRNLVCNEGGTAFPVKIEHSDGSTGTFHGMTLRDYFAGQALANIADSYNGQAFDPNGFARIAYEYADAMLAARGES